MSLSSAQWKRVFQCFDEVLQCAPAKQHTAAVELAGEDLEVRAEIIKLLDSRSKIRSSFLLSSAQVAPIDGESRRAALAGLADFRILDLIAEGRVAAVYRAVQISLNREVALKVSSIPTEEARTMAHLRHHAIVQVYSHVPSPDGVGSLTCMQLINGISLDRIFLAARGATGNGFAPLTTSTSPLTLNGSNMLTTIDAALPDAVELTPSERLARGIFAKLSTTCVLTHVTKIICEALAYAHSRGVLHLDVKPGNIIIDRTGQAHLMDFNVSIHLTSKDSNQVAILGGTAGYMSPEQALAMSAALASSTVETPNVDHRSDIYSIGQVLDEWLSLIAPTDGSRLVRAGLTRATAICCNENPIDRFANVEALSAEIVAIEDVARLERSLPRNWWLAHFLQPKPLTVLVLSVLVPNAFASTFQIAYNWLYIISALSPAQKAAFQAVVPPWNLFVFATGLFYIWGRHRKLFSSLSRGAAGVEQLPPRAAKDLREDVLLCTRRVTAVTVVGWLAGFCVFFVTLYSAEKQLSRVITLHLAVSFGMAAVLAGVYAGLSSAFVAVRSIFPRLLVPSPALSGELLSETAWLSRRIGILRFLTGGLPLLAALSMLVSFDSMTTGALTAPTAPAYRWVIGGFIVAGAIGISISIRLVDDMRDIVAVLRGTGSANTPPP